MDSSSSTLAATGPVTIDDVRAALGDKSPNSTNAGALRAKLGRGSTSTIQKHLDKLRAELLPPAPSDNSAPAAPGEVLNAIWVAAWSAAQAQTLGKLAQVTHERDAARDRIEVLTADIAAAAVEIDAARELLASRVAEVESCAAAFAAESEAAAHAATVRAEQLVAELAAVRSELDKARAAAAHAAELAKRDAELKDAAHERIVSGLTDQVGELKSLLHAARK